MARRWSWNQRQPRFKRSRFGSTRPQPIERPAAPYPAARGLWPPGEAQTPNIRSQRSLECALSSAQVSSRAGPTANSSRAPHVR